MRSHKKRNLEEQHGLSLTFKACRDYLVELASLKGKTHWDSKRNNQVSDLPRVS